MPPKAQVSSAPSKHSPPIAWSQPPKTAVARTKPFGSASPSAAADWKPSEAGFWGLNSGAALRARAPVGEEDTDTGGNQDDRADDAP